VRQIFEKCYEYNIYLHNIFIDYSQAFDSVSRNKIIECLTKYDVPEKIIRSIGLTFTKSTAKVKIGNQLTEAFRIVSRVKQDDPLSATLFSIVINNVLKQLGLKGNVSIRITQCCSAYADNTLITTRTSQALVATFQKLKEISAYIGLKIEEQKAEYLSCTKKHPKVDGTEISGTHLEQAKSIKYKYLGSLLNGKKLNRGRNKINNYLGK
jgi:hypothetical protein